MPGQKILVIDDESDLRQVIAIRLESMGYEPLQAGDGKEGVHLAQKHLPSLIILDIMLPDFNGNEVAQILKGNKLTQRIPIIMLTGKKVERQDHMEGLHSGALYYLTKPFETKDLQEKIGIALSARL